MEALFLRQVHRIHVSDDCLYFQQDIPVECLDVITPQYVHWFLRRAAEYGLDLRHATLRVLVPNFV